MPKVILNSKIVAVKIDRKDCEDELTNVLLALRDALTSGEVKAENVDTKALVGVAPNANSSNKRLAELIPILSNGRSTTIIERITFNTWETITLNRRVFELVGEELQPYKAFCERLRQVLMNEAQCVAGDFEDERITKPVALVEYYMRFLMAAALSKEYIDMGAEILNFLEKFSSQLAQKGLYNKTNIWGRIFLGKDPGLHPMATHLQTKALVEMQWLRKIVSSAQERDRNYHAINSVLEEIQKASNLTKGFLIAFLDPDNTNLNKYCFAPNSINHTLRGILTESIQAAQQAHLKKMAPSSKDSKQQLQLVVFNEHKAEGLSTVGFGFKSEFAMTDTLLNELTGLGTEDGADFFTSANCTIFCNQILSQIHPNVRSQRELELKHQIHTEVYRLLNLLTKLHRLELIINYIHTLNHMLSWMLFIAKAIDLDALKKAINETLLELHQMAKKYHDEASPLKDAKTQKPKPTFDQLLLAQTLNGNSYAKLDVKVGNELICLGDPTFLKMISKRISHIFGRLNHLAQIAGFDNFVLVPRLPNKAIAGSSGIQIRELKDEDNDHKRMVVANKGSGRPVNTEPKSRHDVKQDIAGHDSKIDAELTDNANLNALAEANSMIRNLRALIESLQTKLAAVLEQEAPSPNIFDDTVTEDNCFVISCMTWPNHKLYVPDEHAMGWVNCLKENCEPGLAGRFTLKSSDDGKSFTMASQEWPDNRLYVRNDVFGGLLSVRYSSYGSEAAITLKPRYLDGVCYYLMSTARWSDWNLYVSYDGRIKSWHGDPGPQGYFRLETRPKILAQELNAVGEEKHKAVNTVMATDKPFKVSSVISSAGSPVFSGNPGVSCNTSAAPAKKPDPVAVVDSSREVGSKLTPVSSKGIAAVALPVNLKGLFKLNTPKVDQEKLSNAAKRMGLRMGEAIDNNDRFFHAIASGINKVITQIPSLKTETISIESLRSKCSDAINKLDKDSKNENWVRNILDVGGYQNLRDAIQFTQKQLDNFKQHTGIFTGLAIAGRPEIEGRLLCQELGIQLHFTTLDEKKEVRHMLVSSRGITYVKENEIDMNNPTIIHIVHYGIDYVSALREPAFTDKVTVNRCAI